MHILRIIYIYISVVQFECPGALLGGPETPFVAHFRMYLTLCKCVFFSLITRGQVHVTFGAPGPHKCAFWVTFGAPGRPKCAPGIFFRVPGAHLGSPVAPKVSQKAHL